MNAVPARPSKSGGQSGGSRPCAGDNLGYAGQGGGVKAGAAVNGANGSGGGHQSVISLERSVKRAEVGCAGNGQSRAGSVRQNDIARSERNRFVVGGVDGKSVVGINKVSA